MELQREDVILFTNINNGKGIRIMPDKNKGLPEWITTTKASEITGLRRDTIAEYCRRYEAGEDDRLVCKKMGRDWWVSSHSAVNFKPDNKGRGRPRSTSD